VFLERVVLGTSFRKTGARSWRGHACRSGTSPAPRRRPRSTTLEAAKDAGFLDATTAAESLYNVTLDQTRRLGALPAPAFRNTKENERGAVIHFIRETLAADMAKLTGPR
jgi:hypothetical protein